MTLQGNVAIVTGASAGVGRAYALALAGEGATVLAAARRLGGPQNEPRDANTLATLVSDAASLPGRIHAQQCDVAVEADIVRLSAHGRVRQKLVLLTAPLARLLGAMAGGDQAVDECDGIVH